MFVVVVESMDGSIPLRVIVWHACLNEWGPLCEFGDAWRMI